MTSRQAGHRVGENLQQIIPLVVYFCQCDDEELVEYSLQAFESFVRRCPKEIAPHVRQIMDMCLKYISYDPNYNYDDDTDTTEQGEADKMDADGMGNEQDTE